MLLRSGAIVFLSLTFGSMAERAQDAAAEAPGNSVDFMWGVKIPLRDGVRLNAVVIKPQAMREPPPTLFALTPYGAADAGLIQTATYFAQNGYVFAAVDCRGRGNSEGRFEPYVNEGPDGYDITEWLARQPWSNGRVAMWGISYLGIDQWSTLKEFPPHLKTIVPTATSRIGLDYPWRNNVAQPRGLRFVIQTSGRTQNVSPTSFWIEKFQELYQKHLPFRDFDMMVGERSSLFQKWVAHPTPDAYWDAIAPTPDDFRRVNIPILALDGYYDVFLATTDGYYDVALPGLMSYYRQLMQYGNPRVTAQDYLILGPWDHGGTLRPATAVGGLKFAEASATPVPRIHKEWYDWVLKDGKKPEFLKGRVTYYVPGAEVWKGADSLETISNTRRILYLDSTNGTANDVFHSGGLTEAKPGALAPDHYVYDPLDVRPAELERREIKDYLTDQRFALNLFGNGLVYHSEAFREDTEVTGDLKLVAWIAMDVPDTDFEVSVDEILFDGSAVHLTDDLMRARYRDSLTQAKLVKPGEINQYEFTRFNFFSRRIAKGSRLRLVLKCPNSINWEKNYNSGGVVAEESGKDARTAHITLYHDSERPSHLEIPVVQ
jgi:hypothetical protein